MFPQPEPQVVRVMREHKELILAQEAGKMQEMASQWLLVEQALEAEFLALADEVDRLRASGQAVNQATLLRLERYQRLMYRARAEMVRFVDWADGDLAIYQERLAGQGLEHAAQAIRAVYLDNGSIGAYFDVLNVEAVEAMIGLAGDGSPLRRYLEGVYPEAVGGMTRSLVEGVAKGLHPEKIAREMAQGFGIGLQPALNTARTEGLRAYRNASLMQYNDSGVVRGYKRLAAHDGRVCPGCLFTEGEFYETLDEFSEHNQGRCTPVPVVIGLEAPRWPQGAEWFAEQSEEIQQSILGDARYKAWKDGASLDAMVKRVSDPVWGGAFVPTPAGELG